MCWNKILYLRAKERVGLVCLFQSQNQVQGVCCLEAIVTYGAVVLEFLTVENQSLLKNKRSINVNNNSSGNNNYYARTWFSFGTPCFSWIFCLIWPMLSADSTSTVGGNKKIKKR